MKRNSKDMKKHVWMAFIMVISMMSCSSPEGQKRTVSAGVLEYDSLSIPIDYPYLGFYYQTAYYQEGKNLYWAGYNHMLHSIEVFDLTNRCTVQSFELEPEGPNGILKNQMSKFSMNDSLFVFECFRLGIKVLSRKDGTLRKTIVPLSEEEDFQLNYRGGMDANYSGGFGMRWNGECLVMPIFAKNGQKMDDAFALSVNLRTSEIENLPLAYPDVIKDELGKYGSLTCPFLTVGEDRIVYNFAYSSRVYVYGKETGEVEAFDMRSNATPNQSEPKDANIKQRNFKKNFEYERKTLRFGEVYYDKTSDTYVRMHHAERAEMFGEQNNYLIVRRCKTGETLEYELPKDFSTRYFVTNGHAYFLLKNKDDVCLRFAVVDLKK